MRAIVSVLTLFFGISLVILGVKAGTSNTVVIGGIQSGSKNIESVPVISDFPPVTEIKDKPIKITTGLSGPLIVSDFTGLGDGWRLGVWASQFTEQDKNNGATLPKGSLVLSFPKNIVTNVGISAPTLNADQPWVLDGDMPITIMKTEKDKGAGGYELEFPEDALHLTLNPGTTSKDPTKYKTTITWMLIAGP